MPVSGGSRYDMLEGLLGGGERDRIHDSDEAMWSHEQFEMVTIVTINRSRLVDIGPLITRTDRELRRAVAILGTDPAAEASSYTFGRRGARPRPIPASAGGLLVTDASSGSLHLVVEAYGAVLDLLVSKPVSALVAVLTLAQGVGIIRSWFGRQKNELDGISAQQALAVLKNFGGDATRLMSGDSFDYELEILPAPDEAGLAESRRDEGVVPEEPPIPKSTLLVGEIEATGLRITHIRTYPDGTQDIVYVES
jgi:hypothetical protein